MIQSHVIEVEGAFVGAAVRQGASFRFVAIDHRVEELDGAISASLADTQRLAAALVRSGRLPEGPRP